MNITAFLPCRKGSQRVPKKNIRPFAGFSMGLIELKLKQLLVVSQIDSVVLSTNDDEIIEYAESLHHPELIIHRRSESLSTSDTSTDDLITHAASLIDSGHILWTHVTSPFVNEEIYDEIISEYIRSLNNGYDSLMTTTLIRGFLWDSSGPINYDRDVEKWPRTQTIKQLHEINSAAFLSSAEIYRKNNDRIGDRPLLFPLDKIQGFDIDWEDDFKIAECIFKMQ